LKCVGVLAPVFDQAEDLVYFEPVLHLLSVVFQRLLVLLDDDLLRGGHVVELSQNLAQLSSVGHIFGLKLGDELLAEFVQVDDIGDAGQGQDVAEQF
jgi:hypothetical protein